MRKKGGKKKKKKKTYHQQYENELKQMDIKKSKTK